MVEGLNIRINTGEITNSDIEEVKEIIKSYLILENCNFPFSPGRGIDLEQYLFEYNDVMSLSAELTYLQKKLETIDPRIEKIDLSISVDEYDRHLKYLNIGLKVKNNEYAIIKEEL